MFNFTDHLGNIRLSYSKDPATNVLKIIEENHYYPFGLKHAGYNSDKLMYSKENETLILKPVPPLFVTSYDKKFNGKSWETELGLNFYDYGARNYDPALGRWMNVDPLAEKSRRWSSYTYCYNNPLIFVDPDGMFATPPDWYIDNITGKILGRDTASTNDIRMIDRRDYNEILEKNSGTISDKVTIQLQNNSIPVCVNDEQIQNEVQEITDLSKKNENQTILTLNRETGEVSAIRGQPGSDGITEFSYNSRTSSNGETYNTYEGNLLLGQVHGHNETQDPNKSNVAGTSSYDKDTASNVGVSIYATDAYTQNVGGQVEVHKVNSKGEQTNNVGYTKGNTSQQGQGGATFNIGLDALKDWSGIRF